MAKVTHFEIEGPDGEIVNWGFETGTANGLIRRGWRPEDLDAGTEVVVEGRHEAVLRLIA